jgi:hypothetical protein
MSKKESNPMPPEGVKRPLPPPAPPLGIRVCLLKSRNEEALPVGIEGNVVEGTMDEPGMLRVLFDNGMNIPMYRHELEVI